jgi:anti-sigma factor RsiW
MGCELSQRDLVPFHFGTLEASERAALESHLLGCAACVKDYLTLKRDLETGATAPAPRAEARDRLRRAVALELRARSPSRAWRWWERPLAAAFAGSTVVFAMLAVHLMTAAPAAAPRSFGQTPGAEGRP